ncbi:porin [Ochrobactrum sp. MYb29]|uniref:porin n=1 Tax=Brucella pituitosa TaxID=571256 RepID=UPI000C27C806|nr:porin [Brucella pituitosa]PJO48219.1 porin [Brucella pituitosa]PRA79372.1 porin [Ochrobactrum sp. MYb29]TCQ72357.1 porin-like protein [Ochrobactrum sp. BH3]
MNIKSFLLGSAAALVAVTGAQAADAIVAPEPESVEYVRVCDAYGAGYFYIPGTETCLRVSGYVRYDAAAGDNVYARDRSGSHRLMGENGKPRFDGNDRDTYEKKSRFTLRFTTASETELGTLKSYAETRYDWNDGVEGASGQLRYGYIQLGGLRLGLDESNFVTFTGYLGDVINDDVILAGGYRTNAISYTFNGGNGFSAVVALEQGNDVDVDAGTYVSVINGSKYSISGRITDYTPHIVAGVKYAQGWGSVAAVGAYDSVNEEWAGKVRMDVALSDQLSVWVQGGYKSNKDTYYYSFTDTAGNLRGVRQINSFYGTWGGDWAVWGGAKFKANEKATINVQLAYEDAKTFAATANVAYELVPGFTVTPEVSYTKWDDKQSVLKGQDAFQGMVRFQRSF